MNSKAHRVRDDMLSNYDFSKGEKGKYLARYKQGVSVRIISSAQKSRQFSFQEDGSADTAQLGDLLFLIRGAYAAGLDALTSFSRPMIIAGGGTIKDALDSYLARLDVTGADSLFTRDLGQQTLVTSQLSCNSPLEMTLKGAEEGLLAAVYLAGGNVIDLADPSKKIVMPPVSIAIDALRKALGAGIGAPLGFGIRSRLVRLSKEEFQELMRHDPLSKQSGGFQRLLINLQQRIDKRTRELYLYEPEMETIIRSGRNPSKGGWQKSINRIFGRHFGLNREQTIKDTPLVGMLPTSVR